MGGLQEDDEIDFNGKKCRNYFLVRINAHDGAPLLDSLKDARYQLVFSATERALFAQQVQQDGVLDLSYSIGARIRQNGVVQSVSWDSSAFKAGVIPGMSITAIDGEAFSFEVLRRRLQAASPAPIRLTVISYKRSRGSRGSQVGLPGGTPFSPF